MSSSDQAEPLLELEVSNVLKLKGDVKSEVVDDLKSHLIIENPKWVENNRLGFSNDQTPQHLEFIKKHNGYWTMPRGFFDKLLVMLQNHSCAFMTDFPLRTAISGLIDYEFQGTLRQDQLRAAESALFRPFGVMCLPTGVGKTATALYCIAKRRQTALVVVHTKELLYQWQKEISKFLGIPNDEVGLIGDGKFLIGDKVTVAMIKTLVKRVDEVKDHIGFLVVDECHHTPARTFRNTVVKFRSRYMLGLSATPDRSDGLDELINFYVGDLLYYEGTKKSIERGTMLRPRVHPVNTGFDCEYRGDFSALIQRITDDEKRLELVVEAVSFFIIDGGVPLIVSDRKAHCERLAGALTATPEGFQVGLLTSSVKQPKRKRIIEQLESGEIHALVATGNLIGEGFDCKRLNGLFLTTPFKDANRLKQMVGRITRTDEGKRTPEIWDFVDKLWRCQSYYQSRREVYQAEGYAFAPSGNES